MTVYQSALNWLDRGVSLLPVQPNAKHLVAGFGQHQKQVTTPQEAALWWNGRTAYNLAVCCPPGLLALDFDNNESFYTWQEALPTELITTYHEITPRGWHVFYWCSIPKGIRLKPGVEIKPVVCVSPSVVNGFKYNPIEYPVKRLTDQETETVLSLLLSEEKVVQVSPVSAAGTTQNGVGRPGSDLVSKIKTAVSVLALASSLTKLTSSDHGRGRWFKGCCPFHEDKTPSFWVDTQRGMWGCYACGTRGDVINLYSVAHGLTVSEAISDLSKEVKV